MLKRVILRAALGIGGLLWCVFIPSGKIPIGDILATAILGHVFLAFFEAVAENWDRVWLYFLCCSLRAWQNVRLSISYLIIIKVSDKFLLVRGGRIRDQFQPVGGVYKRYPSSLSTFQSLRVKEDNHFGIDAKSRDDLRIRIRGWRVPAFLRWFDSEKNREIGAWREFHEELIATKILDPSVFTHANLELLRRHENGMHYSPHVQLREILIADIFAFIPTPAQEAVLLNLANTSSPNMLWVTEEEILAQTTSPKLPDPKRISPTATWLIE